MEAPRDLFLTQEFRLCESGSPEAAFLFHRKGQVITAQEEATYAVSAYLERIERWEREREREMRAQVLAEAKAVAQSEVEDKAMAGPTDAKTAIANAIDHLREAHGRRG